MHMSTGRRPRPRLLPGPGAATTGDDVFVAVARPSREAGDIASEVGSLEGHMFRVDLSPAKAPIAGGGTSAGQKSSHSRLNSPSIELEAAISRVLSPPIWQSSEVAPRIVLRFVVNR